MNRNSILLRRRNKVIITGNEDYLRQVFTRMVSSRASVSETDAAELKWFVENYGLALPDSIPNKEVLASVGGLMPDDPGLRRHRTHLSVSLGISSRAASRPREVGSTLRSRGTNRLPGGVQV
jgi:hypothetical protein